VRSVSGRPTQYPVPSAVERGHRGVQLVHLGRQGVKVGGEAADAGAYVFGHGQAGAVHHGCHEPDRAAEVPHGGGQGGQRLERRGLAAAAGCLQFFLEFTRRGDRLLFGLVPWAGRVRCAGHPWWPSAVSSRSRAGRPGAPAGSRTPSTGWVRSTQLVPPTAGVWGSAMGSR
jgi:hypothetical protein